MESYYSWTDPYSLCVTFTEQHALATNEQQGRDQSCFVKKKKKTPKLKQQQQQQQN